MGGSHLLTCKNLNFSHQGKAILSEISLEFNKGEFIGILGCNGAGKTTLLSCLAGLLPANYDVLTIEDLNLKYAKRKDIAKHLSIVPQEHGNMFPFCVLDVVLMGRTSFIGIFGAPEKKDLLIAKKVMSELGIDHLKKRIFTTLSGGEKQMVLLARAMVQTKKMIFLDEPTNHLDYRNRYHMLSKLKSLTKDSGTCVVACLHDPNHALLFADKVILMEKGKIIANGNRCDVLTGAMVSRLYDIPVTQNNSSGFTQISPVFVNPDYKGRVLLLTGESGAGKTTLLEQAIKLNNHLNFGGIICPGTFKNGRRYNSVVKSLGDDKISPFATRTNKDGSGPFVFHDSGRKLSDFALDASKNENRDCIIVDEIGPLELKGGGHSNLLSSLLCLGKPKHIWVVRPSIIKDVCRKWMLVEHVIVDVRDDNALEKVCSFLNLKGEINA